MNGSTRMGLCASLVLAAAACAQPALTQDLGVLTPGTPVTGTLTGFAAGQIKWIGFEITGVTRANGDFLDINTNGGTLTGTDSMIGLYNATGGRVAIDDDDGPSAYSMLSFGATTPTRPASAPTGNATLVGLAHAGGDGANLAPGKYYLAVTGFGGTVFSTTTPWGVTSTHTRTGDVAYRINWFLNATPTNPSGVGSWSLTSANNCGDNAVVASVLVTAGGNPTSTGLTVTANLSSIGGSSSQQLFDNGTNGDATAGDGRYSFGLLVGSGTSPGTASFGFSISDAQGRTAQGTSGTMSIVACPPPAPSNDNCAGAIPLQMGVPAAGYVTTRSTAVNPGACGPFSATTTNYRTAWYTHTGNGNTFTVSTDSSLTNFDTIVGVYCLRNGCGTQTCIAGDDDSGTGNTSLVSFCTDPGATYAVVVAGFSGATGSFEVVATDSQTPCTGAITCAPTGACCILASNSCQVSTAAACEAAGGVYQGNGTVCGAISYGDPNVASGNFPIAIPDFVAPTPGSATSTLVVSGAGSSVDALKVCVGLTHTWSADLIVTLSNSVHSARLMNRVGGSADLGGTYCFSSDASLPFSVVPGTYVPADSLSVFTGDNADDTWTLTVTDNAGSDIGTIDSFAVTFGTTTATCSFCPACAADFNQDGGVDGADVSAFFPEWENAGSCADVNQDGGIDGGDIDAFFTLWENGGC